VYFHGDRKASLYCILRNRWKKFENRLVSQNTLKNTGPRAVSSPREGFGGLSPSKQSSKPLKFKYEAL